MDARSLVSSLAKSLSLMALWLGFSALPKMASAAPVELWTVDAGGPFVAKQAIAVKSDTYLAIEEQTAGSGVDVLVRKLDASGNIAWTYRAPSVPNRDERSLGLNPIVVADSWNVDLVGYEIALVYRYGGNRIRVQHLHEATGAPLGTSEHVGWGPPAMVASAGKYQTYVGASGVDNWGYPVATIGQWGWNAKPQTKYFLNPNYGYPVEVFGFSGLNILAGKQGPAKTAFLHYDGTVIIGDEPNPEILAFSPSGGRPSIAIRPAGGGLDYLQLSWGRMALPVRLVKSNQPVSQYAYTSTYAGNEGWGYLNLGRSALYPTYVGPDRDPGETWIADDVLEDANRIFIFGRINGMAAVAAYSKSEGVRLWVHKTNQPSLKTQGVLGRAGTLRLWGQAPGGSNFVSSITHYAAVLSVTAPPVLRGGRTYQATIELDDFGNAADDFVGVYSSDVVITQGPFIRIPAGTRKAQFYFTPKIVNAPTNVVMRTIYAGVEKQHSFEITPPQLSSITFRKPNSSTVLTSGYGGDAVRVELRLDAPSPPSYTAQMTWPSGVTGSSQAVFSAGYDSATVNMDVLPTSVASVALVKARVGNGVELQSEFMILAPRVELIELANGFSNAEGGLPIPFRVTVLGRSDVPIQIAVQGEGQYFGVANGFLLLANSGTTTGTVDSLPPPGPVSSRVTATLNGFEVEDLFVLHRGRLIGINVPSQIQSATTSYATIRLANPAPVGGVEVTVSYGPGLDTLGLTSPTVTIPAGTKDYDLALNPPAGTDKLGTFRVSHPTASFSRTLRVVK